mmetsp:Transcript_17439/g.27274  ORF Transcript_17439/g.27274 Transcript_17439/m.27274 type:complete len:605 (-) Transcript_17439:14-1828(-)|eukprot:CAMPEP_0201506774 /NCGR_PEP_ID=MMETSP0161_2-20130828/627_1 /ASSEMBLY_ACC=CAM_ASM_000251 /TAXON_ID=180227 /ORGANISM="Neoparamoeba aestuarina, Strain SoJaBio B1-5/56/2" /LENGTH=604 /DNA_ID=CAMNT_0047900959 /DNA_START=33 /DNA_END=1847 /DNA_ORIENTATION=-
MSLQKDVEAKEKLKYEQQRGKEEELRNWIATVLPERSSVLTDFSISLHDVLKDGVILCELILSIISSKEEGHEWSKIRKPRIHPAGQGGFKERENITTYLNLCKKIGLSDSLCFETNDLYDAKGLSFVINNISLIHRLSQGQFDPKTAAAQIAPAAAPSSPAPSSKPASSRTPPPQQRKQEKEERNFGGDDDEEEDDDDFEPSDGGFLGGDDDEDDDDFVPSDGGFLGEDGFGDDEEEEGSSLGGGGSDALSQQQPAISVPSLDDDMKTKAAFSYNSDVEAAVKEWIEKVLNEKVFPSNIRFADVLKSGVVLCRLVNALQAGLVARVHESKIAFKQIENIGNYIKACSALGLSRMDSFDVPDLFDEKNMTLVVEQIARLARYVNNILKLPGVPEIAKTKTRDLWAASLVESSEQGGVTPSQVAFEEMTLDQKDLVGWLNSILEKYPPLGGDEVSTIENIVEIRVGLPVLRALEVLSGGTVGGYVRNPTTTWHYMQNVSQVFRFLSSQFFERIVECTESEVVTGKAVACEALLRYVRRKYDREYDVKREVLSMCLEEMGEMGRRGDDEFIQTVLHGLDLQDEEGMMVNLEKFLGGLSGHGGEEAQ